MFKEKIKVKKAKLYEEHGRYYIDVTYLAENERWIKEIHMPMLPIPLEKWTGNIDTEYLGTPVYNVPYREKVSVKLGDLLMPLLKSDRGGYSEEVYFTEKTIEEKVQEMTIDEIEKKLGLKIKIVSKK